MKVKKTYEVDGSRFSTLEEFFDEISAVLIPSASWGRNLDAFNDILRGGFGTPEEGFTILWKNSNLSREKLGYPETIRWIERKLTTCHPDNVPYVKRDLIKAKNGKGETLFGIIIGIIQKHGPLGEEAEDAVDLTLE